MSILTAGAPLAMADERIGIAATGPGAAVVPLRPLTSSPNVEAVQTPGRSASASRLSAAWRTRREMEPCNRSGGRTNESVTSDSGTLKKRATTERAESFILVAGQTNRAHAALGLDARDEHVTASAKCRCRL